MTTIVNFPSNRIVREVQPNNEDVEKAREKGKQNYADGIAEELAIGILAELENYGIELQNEEGKLNKDFVFLADVLKSVIYRSMNLKHSLHEFVDENVSVFNDEEDYKTFLNSKDENEDKEDE